MWPPWAAEGRVSSRLRPPRPRVGEKGSGADVGEPPVILKTERSLPYLNKRDDLRPIPGPCWNMGLPALHGRERRPGET